MNRKAETAKLALSMCIFGTIGLFRRWIPYSSGLIACARGVIGALFLICVLAVKRRRIEWKTVRKYLIPLIISGVCLGTNWLLLFEAYNHTSVSVATVCYYMAPLIATVAAVFLFREKLTAKKTVCILVACVGLILVSGVLQDGFSGLTGILLGLGAAVLYASVVLLNRYMDGIGSYDRTIMQLAVSSVAIGIYTALTDDFSQYTFSWLPAVLLLLVGVLHTGVAYTLYFGSMNALPTQTVSIFSYIDPVLSILLSAVILKESLTPLAVIGMVMVLGGTVISEVSFGKKNDPGSKESL